MQMSILKLVLDAGYVVKAVLFLLFIFSTVSWAVIIYKQRFFSRADKETGVFSKALKEGGGPEEIFSVAKRLSVSPASNVFKALYADSMRAQIKDPRRAAEKYGNIEAAKLENHLGFLATTGTSTPFIGLFGTVWGIMDSFIGIGSAGTASLSVVAPGIAEALIATAMGLFAAIPAVIAYNHFMGRARRSVMELEGLAEDIILLFPPDKQSAPENQRPG